MGAYAWRHGQGRTAERLGVSRHTVWRFLYRGHAGRRLPRAVLDSFDGDFGALISATWKLSGNTPSLALDPDRPNLPGRLRDTLALLCATPLATVEELSSIGRIPNSTLRGRLARLTERGLVDSIPHRLSTLGPHATRRYFPTEKGIVAAGAAAGGLERLLEARPVSRQWLRLLAERLDAVAVLYHAAAMIADADPSGVSGPHPWVPSMALWPTRALGGQKFPMPHPPGKAPAAMAGWFLRGSRLGGPAVAVRTREWRQPDS